MEKVLSGITVTLAGNEVVSGINGSALFAMWKGTYDYAIIHPDYFPLESSLELGSDTTLVIILQANKARLKFRVYAQDKPLHNADLLVDDNALSTSQTGIALLEDLPRFEAYDWSVSKEGFESLTGTVDLQNDTTVNLSMNLINLTEIPGLEGLRLYPNPASTTLFIKSPVIINRVELCDLRAAVLENLDTNNREVEIDISGYPCGIYVAHIYRDGLGTHSLKVVKSK